MADDPVLLTSSNSCSSYDTEDDDDVCEHCGKPVATDAPVALSAAVENLQQRRREMLEFNNASTEAFAAASRLENERHGEVV